MDISIEEINAAEAWHEILAALPHPHPLQTWTWGAFKARWGWSAKHLAFKVNGDLAAAALLLKRKIPYTPFSILYIPKGPVFDYENVPLRLALQIKLEQIAQGEGAIFLKIDPDVPHAFGVEAEEPVTAGQKMRVELAGRGWHFSDDQIQFRNTVTLDLTRSEEELLAAMKQKTRYNIRLAGRRGVVVRQGTPADFSTLIEMYTETAARDDFLIRPAAYYLDAWASLYAAGFAQPFIAEYEGLPLGAVIIVRFGEKAIYMYGASTDRERKRMPNYLLQWEAICWAKAQGCRIYDFWGAPDEFVESDSLWGVWRFKAGFNGRVTHHIGAWDYPARPWLYRLYTRVIPRYLALLKGGQSTD